MGWLIPYNMPHRKDLILDRIKGWTNEDDTTKTVVTCLKHCYRGGIRSGSLWKVMEIIRTDKATNKVVLQQKFIALDLLRYYPEGHGMGNFGFKDLEESCGPCEISCPISYLDMVPDPGGYATAWRERVRARYLEKRANKVQNGRTNTENHSHAV